MVAVAPVVESDADLQDAVVQPTDRGAGVAPEELERLVLLEELAGVELLDPATERVGRRLVAARAGILIDRAPRDALGGTGGLAVAASAFGWVRRRVASGSGARRR